METLVLGLGNPILTDDGVGVRIAEAVRTALPSNDQVEIDEASVGGLELLERLLGYRRVFLIDAFHPGQKQPGTIHRLELEDLRDISPTQHSASAHDTTLVTAWDMARQMDLPLPEELVIYAIEVANITEFGEELTPAVAQAIPKVTAAILAELDKIVRPV
jgi:hydrogenase maturation protease